MDLIAIAYLKSILGSTGDGVGQKGDDGRAPMILQLRMVLSVQRRNGLKAFRRHWILSI